MEPTQKHKGGRNESRTKENRSLLQAPLPEWAAALIDSRRAQIEKDLDTLPPRERAALLAQLLAVASTSHEAKRNPLEEKGPASGPRVLFRGFGKR